MADCPRRKMTDETYKVVARMRIEAEGTGSVGMALGGTK